MQFIQQLPLELGSNPVSHSRGSTLPLRRLILAIVIALLAGTASPLHAQNNGDILLWNSNAGSWTNGNRWFNVTENERTGVNTAFDRFLTYDMRFQGDGFRSKEAPTSMTIGGVTLHVTSLTFENGFNSTNTTTLANDAATPASLVLGASAGGAGGAPIPWTITNNATSGMITIAPRSVDATADLSLSLYSSGTISVAGGGGITISAAINNFSTTQTGGITKVGAGQLILSGPNTYTGETKISGGTLLLGASDRIGNSSRLNLNGGTFATGGFSEALGGLTLSANSTLDLGATGASTLTFLGATAYTAGTLTILNWTGTMGSIANTDRILFSSSSGITPAFLDSIVFQGFNAGNPGAALLDNGDGTFQLTPIPEPATVLGALALLGLALFRERSWIVNCFRRS